MSDSAAERSPSASPQADPRPANTPWLTPYLCVRDAKASTSSTQAPHLFYLYVNAVDGAHARALAAGGTSIMAPQDAFWGDRFCQIEDLDGYRWGLAHKPVAPAAPAAPVAQAGA